MNALDDRKRSEQAKEEKAGLEVKEEEKKTKRDWGKTAGNAGRNIKDALSKL